MEVECPECGALNEVENEHETELLVCWQCGHEHEYDPE